MRAQETLTLKDVGDFGGLVDRRRVIEKRLAGLDKLEEQRATVGARAVEALADIEAWRAELTRRRIAFCEDLTAGCRRTSWTKAGSPESSANCTPMRPNFLRNASPP